VGKGNTVGNKSPTGNAGQPLVKGVAVTARANSPKTKRICGAMSQQRGDAVRGDQSAPQKLVQLVGYRDPKPRPEPSARVRPAPVK
jgi:hypothetical protein